MCQDLWIRCHQGLCCLTVRLLRIYLCDGVTLTSWDRRWQSTRTVLGTRELVFHAIPPGVYLLTLDRAGCRMRLLLRLPPGANITVCHDGATGRVGWYREWAKSWYCPYC